MSPRRLLQDQLTTWFMRRTAPSGVRRVSSVSAAVASEVGIVRTENQDRVAIARSRDHVGRPFTLAAVADGIGGMQDGALCAAMTLGHLFGTIVEEARTNAISQHSLLRCVNQANAAVHAKYRGEGGSTLVAVLVAGDGSVHWASVGDSRVYHASASKLTRLSIDDTIAGQLGKDREVSLDQSKLLQFIGIGAPIEPGIGQLDASATGQMLLTSDGVHFLDTTPWFAAIVGNAPDPGLCVRRLTDLSKSCGGPDNASAALIGLDVGFFEPVSMPDMSLEIWDPFGDLQVILDIPLATPVAEKLPRTPTASNDLLTPPTQAEQTLTAPPVAASKVQRKPKKARVQKKAKQSGGKIQEPGENRAADKDEAPQLLMEFPNKTR